MSGGSFTPDSPAIIRAVIWDLGGVIIRTEDWLPRQSLADRLNITRRELEDLVFSSESGLKSQRGEISVDQHWRNVSRSLGLGADQIESIQAAFWGGDRLDARLVEAIRALKGNYRIGLLSNHYPDLRQNLENRWGIADLFDEMIISAEVGLLKPDARIYLEALRRMQVQPEQSLFIDDYLPNVEGAQRVGIHAIHFHNTYQALEDLAMILEDGIL